MRRLLIALVIATVVASSALVAVESLWRGRGYAPVIVDSLDLWSSQRAKVYPRDGQALVFIGASRTLYAIDRGTLLSRLPNHVPVMLALDGRYPLATLRDLALDENFRGIIVCDIDAAGLAPPSLDLQKKEVDYYHHEFSPSRALHRLMLNHWQSNAVISRTDFSLVRSAARWWSNEGEPFRPYQWLDRRRFGFIDYTRGDPTVQPRQLAEHIAKHGGHLPKFAFEKWWPQIEETHHWVRALQARGGDVVFYSSPTSGQRRDVEEDWFPRAEYWDKMAAATPAKTLHALDVPALRDFPLPDDSHIDYRQKPAYTKALVDALLERGLISAPN